MSLPLTFVRQYLRIKGRKELEILACPDCDIDYLRFPYEPNEHPFDHPMQFLYDHASKGHKVRLVVCFYWFWTAGGGRYHEGWDTVPWMGCKTFGWQWSPERNCFILDYTDEDKDWS